jgi:release factor glutamine methyltransferase
MASVRHGVRGRGDDSELPPAVGVGHYRGLEVSGSTFWPKDQKLERMVLMSVGGVLRDGFSVLEVGTGSGVLTKALVEGCGGKSVRFVATDSNPSAVRDASRNLSGLDRVEVRSGDMFSPLRDGERFDVVLWNPPWFSEAGDSDLARYDEGHRSLGRFVDGVFGRLNAGGRVFVVLPQDNSKVLWDKADVSGFGISEADSYVTGRRRVVLYELTARQ